MAPYGIDKLGFVYVTKDMGGFCALPYDLSQPGFDLGIGFRFFSRYWG